MPEFKSVLGRHPNSLSQSIFSVPDQVAQNLIEQREDKRVICTINDQHTYHCALLPDGDGGFYIMVNKQIRKKVGIDYGDKLHIFLKADPSKYGMPLPEEFEEVMNTDPEGMKYFESLSPGKQRSLIHIVGKIKRSDLRITTS